MEGNYVIKKFENMQYVIRLPDGYTYDKKYPVLLFFHGAGTRGNDINKLINHVFFEITGEYKKFPFILVAPLCSADTWFDIFETVLNFVKKIYMDESTDIDRVYAMGASMGGYAVWQMAMSCPDIFAAIVPICGGGMYWNASRLINVPVWAFHGAKDDVVYKEESEKMVKAVKDGGGNAKLTIYSENSHDAWTDTFKNYEVFKWLLSNQKAHGMIKYKKISCMAFG